MINNNIKTIYSSQANGLVTIELEFPKHFQEKDWPRKFKNCQAIFEPQMNKLLITCQTVPLTARKTWLEVLVETKGYFW
ncbi:MAG: hypothetical protein QNJ38_09900 [Prochloraceae cyanobacterium]|nr:hypothetical protein [Prochloraceae cyanobacterium]